MAFESGDKHSTVHHGLDQTVYSLNLLLNPNEIIDKIRHAFLGEELEGDPKDNIWKKIREPIMDEAGVSELMLLLSSTISIPIVLGNLTEAEYKRIVAELSYATLDFLFFNAQKYHIAHSNYKIIVSIIKTDFRAFLSRARGGFQQVHVSKSYGAHESVEQRHSSQEDKDKRLI